MKQLLIFLLFVLILMGCSQPNDPAPTPAVNLLVPPPLATATQPAAPPVIVTQPEALLDEATTTVFPTSVAPVTDPTFNTPAGQPASAASVSAIIEPLLIYGERGRLYAQAQVNAQPKTVVLSTTDGHLLASFPESGRLALDRTHNRLIVDRGDGGLAILDAITGHTLLTVLLPPAEQPATPQVDPTTGRIYAFRDQTIYVIEPTTGAIEQTVELNVPTIICGQPGNPAAITNSQYDLVNQRLYLTFITYACTPWVGVSIIAYDAATLIELGQQGAEIRHQFVPFSNNLYGTSVSRLGPTSYWAWNEDGAWFQEGSDYVGNLAGIVADWQRQLIYEAIGQQVRIIDPSTRHLISQVEVALLASDGRLAAHDPISDNLYFLTGFGQLHLWPAANLFSTSQSPPPTPMGLSPTAVRALTIAADGTIAGLWDNGLCLDEGNVLYLLPSGGSWFHSQVNYDGRCDSVAAMALSPNFSNDQTLFAAANNISTIWKSSDGGRFWQPAGPAFPAGTHFRDLFISSGFSQDATLFVTTTTGELHRSADGGQTWALVGLFDQVAISPEFGQDRTLLASAANQLSLSRDGGDSWQLLGSTPNNESLALLSIAPLFTRWSAVFAFTTGGGFYRSLDGGHTWELAIGTAYETPLQLVYAPDIEVDRPIFFLHGRILDSSYDGWNSTWSGGPGDTLRNTTITALAISPNYINDGLLYLGTADGHLFSVDASRPQISN